MSQTVSKTFPRVLMVSFFVPPWFFAGAGNQAVLLAREILNQRANNIAIITSLGDRGWVKSERLEGIPVFLLRGSRRHKLLNFILFNLLSIAWWFIHAKEFDIVHIHGATRLTTLIWIPLAKFWGKRSLLKITCSGVDDFPGLRQTALLGAFAGFLASQADGYIALTPEIKDQLQKSLPGKKVFLVPNGFDSSLFFPVTAEEKKRLRLTLGLPEDGIILIYTGGINPRKNVMFLVESFHLLKQRYNKIFLCLTGPCKDKFQSYGREIRSYIDESGLASDVFIYGELPYREVSNCLKASDIFLFASLQEGLPSSPIEAMACGLPSVVLKLPGVTDWLYKYSKQATPTQFCGDKPDRLQDQAGGEVAIVTEKDINEFAEKISWLLDSPGIRETMSQRAASHAKERFEASALALHYLNHIYPVLLE